MSNRNIAEVIGEETWITGEKKERLLKNAKRLGDRIRSSEVDDPAAPPIQLPTGEKRTKVHRPPVGGRRPCIVVFLGFGLFVYTQLQPRKNETETTAKQKNEKDSVSKKISAGEREPKSPDWWGRRPKSSIAKKQDCEVNGFSEVR